MRWRVVAVTSELGGLPFEHVWTPVVRHEFYGATPQEAIAIANRHKTVDGFLAGCERGIFGTIQCKTDWSGPEPIDA